MKQDRSIDFAKMRRRDRAIEDREWIQQMLCRSPIGTLATIGPDGPKLNPNLFVFDPASNVIYLHTASKGRTRSTVETDSRAAFSVSEMGRLLPAGAAIDFSVEYASVIVEGRSSSVDDEAEARRALMLLMRKYAPQFEPEKDYRGIDHRDLSRTAVFRLDIERWSGKGKAIDADDAYDYQHVSGEGSTPGRRNFGEALSSSFHSAFWAALRDRTRGSE